MSSLSVNGLPISYMTIGQGEPVILLHSGGSHGGQWKELASLVSDRFISYMPDMNGHGRSPKLLKENAPSLNEYAAIVDALTNISGTPCHLVGHSHGGSVAIKYAITNPFSLASLTLIEPTLFHLLRITNNPAWAEIEALGLRHINAVSQGRSAKFADEFFSYWIGKNAWLAVPEEMRLAIIETMPAVAQFWASQLTEKTPADSYTQLGVPTLLIRGTKTKVPANEIVALLDELLPNSRTVDIDGAGHMAPLTHGRAVQR
jgi:pimeloyl-ACP methyl ester carboxylesterase